MADALDMSLDDLIKKNKQSHQPQHQQQKQHRPSPSAASRGGRGAPAFSGPARRFPNRAAARAAPYKAPGYGAQPIPAVAAAAGGGGAGIETGTKLYISNLDYGVSNEDIKELFSEVGDLKRYSINYDRSGRSKGTAEVVFARRSDALSAVKRYNNVQLDGKPMKIEVIGTNIEVPVPVPAPVPFAFNGAFTNFNGPPKSGPGRGGGGGWPRGGGVFGVRGRGRGGRGRGRGGRGNQQVSAADLDADLDKYHAEAMQIN